MSKELEALEEVNNLIDYYVEESTTYDSWQVIIEALTPPTADEVCKALSEFIDREVTYDDAKKDFVDECRNSVEHFLFDSYHLKNIPPHLITMIGRFYERLEK